MRIIPFLLLLLCSGCALFGDYRHQYYDAGTLGKVKLRVPRGFSDKEYTTDSMGHRSLVYRYPYNQSLFITTDTTLSAYIDTAVHNARPHLQGGRFYKGVLPQLQLWREVYSQGLKYGYRNANLEEEPLFDSSLNFIRVK
ncbi:hypothetical protein SAMN05444008_103250 [Cnuella takakiae]|uniref:Lipoprotein n=1 Tax=Cnuella takakiae TaxID=1302690 RepID=A0A1M4X508_9BACT|nr:hypothetical protein [Cnuella takakiae]OLY91531.1 hypothetical protein BUE76_06150 [Cnuella takakiae]SHE88531.1 hypothetical protein SAMN05444008_103250 [Cnuella takakiae]